jgi:uroporphyrinogen-III synthase
MKRILITRPKAQAGEFARLLRAAEYEPVFFPVIEIRPAIDPSILDSALQALPNFDWMVLTSVNGVDAVWERLHVLQVSGLPAGLKIAAIGPKTAAALQDRGVQPDFVPDEYVAEAILPGLGDLKGRAVLLPRADLARKALAEDIRRAGGQASEVVAYHTLPVIPEPEGLRALQEGVSAITLTSSSTARNFAAVLYAAGLDPLALPGDPVYACIGPITADTAREEGLPVHLVAQEYTTEGLLQSLQNHFSKPHTGNIEVNL